MLFRLCPIFSSKEEYDQILTYNSNMNAPQGRKKRRAEGVRGITEQRHHCFALTNLSM